jgi:hypothetical protein
MMKHNNNNKIAKRTYLLYLFVVVVAVVVFGETADGIENPSPFKLTERREKRSRCVLRLSIVGYVGFVIFQLCCF